MILRHRWLLVWLVALPGVAAAHSPIKGINTFYNGVLHPLLVPSHLLVLLALGLLVGQQGAKTHRAALAVFLLAAFAALALAPIPPEGLLPQPALAAVAAACGLLVVIARPLPGLALAVLAAVAGAVVGLDSSPGELAGKEAALFLGGCALGIGLLFAYPLALAEFFSRKPWQRVGVRVLGSWIAASSLLVLALALAT